VCFWYSCVIVWHRVVGVRCLFWGFLLSLASEHGRAVLCGLFRENRKWGSVLSHVLKLGRKMICHLDWHTSTMGFVGHCLQYVLHLGFEHVEKLIRSIEMQNYVAKSHKE